MTLQRKNNHETYTSNSSATYTPPTTASAEN